VFEANRDHLQRYARQLTGDHEAARDAVQDVFVKLRTQPPPNADGNVRAWLFTVCRNHCLDYLRTRRRWVPIGEGSNDGEIPEPSAVTQPSPDHIVEQRDSLGRILAAVARLPHQQAELVRLKFQGQLSYKQMSEITGLTVSHVGVLLHQAMKSLRHDLRHELSLDLSTTPSSRS
jgi:RNA polymerase sigma-70 factor (ECF subfamily)